MRKVVSYDLAHRKLPPCGRLQNDRNFRVGDGEPPWFVQLGYSHSTTLDRKGLDKLIAYTTNQQKPGAQNPEKILASFKQYFRTAEVEDVTAPKIVHELQVKLDKAEMYFLREIEQYAQTFSAPKYKQASLMYLLKPAKDRFYDLEDEDAEQFRKELGTFLLLYDFLSQIILYGDADLEKLYSADC